MKIENGQWKIIKSIEIIGALNIFKVTNLLRISIRKKRSRNVFKRK
ncbi:hypothetical protein CMTB2_04987 [Caminibacter mediatlanticus TB-2]|uniref:Uncharacterized protein n=1 Tax=Caminibacter mediatlanticus TB-2 TaxID=391592 RepID=A0AAI9F1E3_9BACT|nr:hypothetical protein CMTB2_04987 [Caminibacter mediatlanticus TB-2]